MKKLILLVLLFSACHSPGGVVSYLRFEENDGSTAYDETGLMDGDLIGPFSTEPGGGDTGVEGWSTDTPNSTIPQTGESNSSSIRMMGGGYIDLSNYNDLLLNYSFTIELFMKLDETAAQYGATVFGFGSDYSDKLFFNVNISSGKPYFSIQFMNSTVYFLAEEIQFNEWQHVALVKEVGQYSIYLDGELLHTEALSSTLDGPYEFYGDPTMGTRTIGGESGTFRGWLDEFRISDEALSPSQFLNASIPEPGTLGLLGLGAALIAIRKRAGI